MILKHIRLWLLPITLLLCWAQGMSVFAHTEQNIQVKGIVVDATGLPVIGANVVIKGTTQGIITGW